MRKYLKISFLLLSAILSQIISSSANATVFRLDYSGTISSFVQDNGMGFAEGDRVEGYMEFDLANSTGDLFWSDHDASYRALNSIDFVTSAVNPSIGNIPNATGENLDQVYIHNGYLDELSNDTRTVVGIADVYHKDTPWRSFGMAIYVVLDGIDWLTGTDIPEFEFTSSSPYLNSDISRGDLFEDTAVMGPDGQPMGTNKISEFKLDYVRMTKIPEPNSFLLLLVGFAGLVYSRKKLHSTQV